MRVMPSSADGYKLLFGFSSVTEPGKQMVPTVFSEDVYALALPLHIVSTQKRIAEKKHIRAFA